MNEKVKQCLKCKQVLPISEFGKNRRTSDGHYYYCKKCAKKMTLEKYHTDVDYRKSLLDKSHIVWNRCKQDPKLREHKRQITKKSMRKYRRTHRDKINEYHRAKYQLETKGIAKKVWIRSKGKCELCGLQVYREKGKSNYAIHHKNKNRFDNRLENLMLVCTTCHLHKLH